MNILTKSILRLWIFLNAKDVASEIRSLDENNGCCVALVVALVGERLNNIRVPEDSVTTREVCENPANYSLEQCFGAFSILAEVRQLSRDKKKELSANPTLTSETKQLIMEYDTALSLWMSAAGMGCTKIGGKSVIDSWNRLVAFPVSVSDIRVMENMSGDPPLPDDEWIAAAKQKPEFLRSPGGVP